MIRKWIYAVQANRLRGSRSNSMNIFPWRDSICNLSSSSFLLIFLVAFSSDRFHGEKNGCSEDTQSFDDTYIQFRMCASICIRTAHMNAKCECHILLLSIYGIGIVSGNVMLRCLIYTRVFSTKYTLFYISYSYHTLLMHMQMLLRKSKFRIFKYLQFLPNKLSIFRVFLVLFQKNYRRKKKTRRK